MRKPIYTLLLFMVFVFTVKAQDQMELKKLHAELENSKEDSTLAKVNFKISKLYYNIDNQKSLQYCLKALKIAEKCDCNAIEGKIHYMAGMIYEILGKKNKTLDHYQKGLKIFEELDDKMKVADGYVNMGYCHYGLNSFEKAIEFFNKALVIYKNLGDKVGESDALNNLGATYLAMNDLDNSILNLKKSLEINKKTGNKSNIATSLINIGNIYFTNQKYDEALKEYLAALLYLDKSVDESLYGKCITNIGVIYKNQGKTDKAIKYYKEAMEIFRRLQDAEMLSVLYKNYSFCLAEIGRYEEANEYLEQKIVIDDSLSNKYQMDQIAEMSEKYEADKKQKEISLLTKEKKNARQKNQIQKLENEKQQADIERTNTLLYFSLGALFILIAIALLLTNQNRLKAKVNKQLTAQKKLLLDAKQVIESKNKDILDSILYAKRIQEAILQEENKALKNLPQHFVIFKPKDIVSGDFYWTMQTENSWYAAVADCTGHGVPGAFMSMLGIAFLNEITINESIKKPSDILDELRLKVIRELGQTGNIGENKDGMDISLIKFNKSTNEIEFAGAHNSLLVVRNNDIIQLNADKQPIGYQIDQKPFTNTKMKVEKEDTVFLLSDGYADQFGGPTSHAKSLGKKFKLNKFKEMIIGISKEKIHQQKQIIEKCFEDWKGDNEQIDDVCIMAIKFPINQSHP